MPQLQSIIVHILRLSYPESPLLWNSQADLWRLFLETVCNIQWKHRLKAIEAIASVFCRFKWNTINTWKIFIWLSAIFSIMMPIQIFSITMRAFKFIWMPNLGALIDYTGQYYMDLVESQVMLFIRHVSDWELYIIMQGK